MDDTVWYYDDDDYYLLQPKAFFTSEFIQWRVLSIQTNPYQALVDIDLILKIVKLNEIGVMSE